MTYIFRFLTFAFSSFPYQFSFAKKKFQNKRIYKCRFTGLYCDAPTPCPTFWSTSPSARQLPLCSLDSLIDRPLKCQSPRRRKTKWLKPWKRTTGRLHLIGPTLQAAGRHSLRPTRAVFQPESNSSLVPKILNMKQSTPRVCSWRAREGWRREGGVKGRLYIMFPVPE